MIYAMIDLTSDRVVELLPVGDNKATATRQKQIFLQELTDIYAKLTGDNERKFEDLQEAKQAVIEQVGKEYFAPHPEPEPEHEEAGPVATARRVFEELDGRPRREIIEACAKAGVKRSTAATQYQKWKASHAHH